MKNTMMITFLTLAACSSSFKEKQRLAWEAWKDHSILELERHPYFSNLKVIKIKHENDHESWIYKDQTPFQTGAYCQSLGGCLGTPIYNCENIFFIQKEKILNFEQRGSCPSLSTIEAKKK